MVTISNHYITCEYIIIWFSDGWIFNILYSNTTRNYIIIMLDANIFYIKKTLKINKVKYLGVCNLQ